MEEKTLETFLKANNTYPFHMPGHKRNPRFDFLAGVGSAYDITEIWGADNLHDAEGLLLSVMKKAASVWGADKSHILVNGSTGGIIAAMGTLAKRGDKVLVSRNCHKSVYHGLELFGLRPVFVTPDTVATLGVYGALSVEAVATALTENPDAVCLIAVSPTYEGFISDLAAICDLCHNAGVSVLVDEAHGAHLDLSPHFTGGAVNAGADITVQSLHKTMPALTQTAILHVKGNRVDADRLSHMLAVFQTSSPSYLLIASAEVAINLAGNAAEFKNWASLIDEFCSSLSGLRSIRLFRTPCQDLSKLVIVGKNGIELADFLRLRGIETEYSTDNFVLAMTGMGDTCEGFKALANALGEADTALTDRSPSSFGITCCTGEFGMSMDEAYSAPFELAALKDAVGRLSAEYVWAYPPGIPLLLPGQRINAEFSAADISRCRSDRGKLPQLAVIKE